MSRERLLMGRVAGAGNPGTDGLQRGVRVSVQRLPDEHGQYPGGGVFALPLQVGRRAGKRHGRLVLRQAGEQRRLCAAGIQANIEASWGQGW